MTSTEVDGGSKKTQKSRLKRKGLDRSSTFKGRGEDKKERGGGGGGGGGSEAVDSVAHQQLLVCAVRLRNSLEDILVRYVDYVAMVWGLLWGRQLRDGRCDAGTVFSKGMGKMHVFHGNERD